MGPIPGCDTSRIFMQPTSRKYHLLELGNRALVERGDASSKEMERVVGHWVSVMILVGLYLAVVSTRYDFIRCFRSSKKRHPLWGSVKAELLVAAALLPLCIAELTARWCGYAYAVDASGWGRRLCRLGLRSRS